jgi:G:T-mismatch repair DNA endonuclease (very short patch repair protein)
MADSATIDALFETLATQPFRTRFHLRGREAAMVELRGMDVIRRHARELLAKKLVPAHPVKDGKQTPYRGHPVFVAQHATATCCRGCLARWHDIPKGHELTTAERDYVVDVISRWIEKDLAAAGRRAPR